MDDEAVISPEGEIFRYCDSQTLGIYSVIIQVDNGLSQAGISAMVSIIIISGSGAELKA